MRRPTNWPVNRRHRRVDGGPFGRHPDAELSGSLFALGLRLAGVPLTHPAMPSVC